MGLKDDIVRIRKMNPTEYYDYLKSILKKNKDINTDINSDVNLLEWAMDEEVDNNRLKTDYFTIKKFQEWFQQKNSEITEEVLTNIEKTIDGQPIYRELSSCVDLEQFQIKEPIGKYWAYTPETHSFWSQSCPDKKPDKPFLIKGKLLTPEKIDLEQSLLVNLNYVQKGSGGGLEHEIRLKPEATVYVEELCEKNWWGRRSSSGKPMIKTCIPIKKQMKN